MKTTAINFVRYNSVVNSTYAGQDVVLVVFNAETFEPIHFQQIVGGEDINSLLRSKVTDLKGKLRDLKQHSFHGIYSNIILEIDNRELRTHLKSEYGLNFESTDSRRVEVKGHINLEPSIRLF